MSRIHEALKRAEEQRAASQGGHAPLQQNAEVTVTDPSMKAPVVESAPTGVASAVPSFASQFTFDTLLARCPQHNWAPDTKTMLFFNAEEQGYGTEEFRTLRSRLYQMREKLALVEGVPLAIVGTDPPALAVEARRRTRTLVAGSDAAADVHPDHAELDDAGHPRILWAGHEVTVPVTGFHQIENIAIALAVARETGANPARALTALADVRLPPGRGGILTVRGLTVIDDTYNANPASMHWAVRFAHWMATRQRRPLAVVVGSMLELGRESGRLHAAAALEIAAVRPALIGAVGEFVSAFAGVPLEGRLVTAPDAEALGPRLREALQGDEIVLLKASRGAALERVLRHLN